MPDWRTRLMDRYPALFPPRPDGARAGYPSVGDGWTDLLERALGRIAAAVAGAPGAVRITQIKEKFAGIRIYYDAVGLSPEVLSAVDDAIDLAEARAECTCELCGEEGTLCDDAGWYTTRCRAHAVGVSAARGGPAQYERTFYSGGREVRRTLRRYDRAGDRFIMVSDTGAPDASREGGR